MASGFKTISDAELLPPIPLFVIASFYGEHRLLLVFTGREIQTSCPTHSLVGPCESEDASFCIMSSSPKPSDAIQRTSTLLFPQRVPCRSILKPSTSEHVLARKRFLSDKVYIVSWTGRIHWGRIEVFQRPVKKNNKNLFERA